MSMQIYLPIAEVSVNAFLLLGLGGLVGILSGMFGVGDGWRAKKLDKMIKFYDDCDEVSNEWLHRLNAENQMIAARARKFSLNFF